MTYSQAGAATPAVRILSIGEDALLLQSRQMLLRSSGYEVVTIHSHALLEEYLVESIQVVLLCHTIPQEQVRNLVHRLHGMNSALSFLVVAPAIRDGDTEAAMEETRPEPGALLQSISRVTRGTPPATKGTQQEGKIQMIHAEQPSNASEQYPKGGGAVYAFPPSRRH